MQILTVDDVHRGHDLPSFTLRGQVCELRTPRKDLQNHIVGAQLLDLSHRHVSFSRTLHGLLEFLDEASLGLDSVP